MLIALITGASGGIGFSTVKTFIENNYFVIGTYNSGINEIKKLRKELGNLGLADFFFAIKCDFNNEKSVLKTFSIIEQNFKHIDVLVNNAGVDLYKLLSDTTIKEWDKTFNVNVKSAFMCTKFALKSMINRSSGCIINVSSIWGLKGGSMEVAYSASKGALISFTKALAKEVSLSNIRVNCICPGVIDTKMNNNFSKEELEEMINNTPLKRIGTTKEIADLIYFLTSDKAGFITGQVITCDGGFTL